MNQYMLIFHSDPAEMASLSPSEIQATLIEWANWMQGIGQKGALVAGEQLGPQSKIIRSRSKVVSDGPYSEAKESVGGYVIVKADSLDQAAEFAQGCPIFQIHGDVEVRPIMSR